MPTRKPMPLRDPGLSPIHRRNLGRAALAFGATALFGRRAGAAVRPFTWLEQEVTADVNAVREDIREEAAYLLGMISFV
jgi:hypothetical protein